MQRLAATVLLVLFGAFLPSAAVVAMAAPQELLPACCRAHGKHQCTMVASMEAAAAAAASQPAFRNPGCPFRQGLHAVTTTSGSSISGRYQVSVGLTADLGGLLASSSFFPARFFDRSAPRGPPSHSHLNA